MSGWRMQSPAVRYTALPLALVGIALACSGCGSRRAAAEASHASVTRYMVNMVEERDEADVYLEAVNESALPTVPIQIRAVVTDSDGRPRCEAVEPVGQMEPGERRELSIHVAGCTGHLHVWDVELYWEPLVESEEDGR